jgi:hypothetical protein
VLKQGLRREAEAPNGVETRPITATPTAATLPVHGHGNGSSS